MGAAQFLLTDHCDHPLARFYPALTGQPAPADDPYPTLRDFILNHRDQIIAIVATRLVQTNEPARSSYLYPALLAAQRLGGGQPLALIEIGPSAGLTRVPDRYAYDYGTGALHGDPTSPMVFSCALRGDSTPPLAGTLSVRWRIGVDVHPLDLNDPADRQWLRALIWPDHPDRAQRSTRPPPGPCRTSTRATPQKPCPTSWPKLRTTQQRSCSNTAVLAHFTQQARTGFAQRLLELSTWRPITWVQGKPRTDQQPRRTLR
ncbi:MAG: DUF2332 family protein [Pseudonocardiaceae bacterium]